MASVVFQLSASISNPLIPSVTSIALSYTVIFLASPLTVTLLSLTSVAAASHTSSGIVILISLATVASEIFFGEIVSGRTAGAVIALALPLPSLSTYRYPLPLT